MSEARTLNVARLGVVDYAAALELQTALAAARIRDEIDDLLLLLEHPAVFTLGRGADERFLINPPAEIPIYRVSRGGQVTYHGPGQLVGYPILKLTGTDRDVLRYLRNLERVMINALDRCGIAASQRPGLTGVWVDSQKIASIGVGLRRWVTMHGFALNVTTDLSAFDTIVPCGIEGCRTTSIAARGRSEISVNDFAAVIEKEFAEVFAYEQIISAPPEALWRFVASPEGACEAHG
jgi:lipoyl(octanoyl) transferase